MADGSVPHGSVPHGFPDGFQEEHEDSGMEGLGNGPLFSWLPAMGGSVSDNGVISSIHVISSGSAFRPFLRILSCLRLQRYNYFEGGS